uniref:NADH dehydrogenase subunit 4L n=1 Tax=Nasonia vitripennis TaxID=7425 RepID=UPI001E6BC3FD|nr:NADH dehydrogenase subunit 4L [Nasonia vitripennis]QVT11050.1 NADH dehydrogenase subunit 4L [Nasonia vitripennis]UAY85758.1 NADH dehydrogenase subunit 4l [Nasonia vitripennis]UVN15295.1 NADH dehydrogenase subunit 4L [Nasonia vitripennis]
MYLNTYFYIIMFIMSMLMFVYLYNQILLNLICLEFLMLSLLMLLSNLMMLNNSMIMVLFYLVFVVCESVLGLSMLIILIRSYGNDSFKLLNLSKW